MSVMVQQRMTMAGMQRAVVSPCIWLVTRFEESKEDINFLLPDGLGEGWALPFRRHLHRFPVWRVANDSDTDVVVLDNGASGIVRPQCRYL